MDRGSQLDEEDGDDEEEEEDQATDIKSNNPHLAGGEKRHTSMWGKRPLIFCLGINESIEEDINRN